MEIVKKCVISHTTVVSIFLCNWVYLVELGMNTKKTKVIAENVENPEIRTLDGTVLEVVKDFTHGCLDSFNSERYKNQESSCMVCTAQHEQSVEVGDEQQPQAKTVCHHSGKCAAVWLSSLGPHCQG